MSYNCTLTFLNQADRKRKLKQLFYLATSSKDESMYLLLLQWMFEFICSYYFINTTEDVTLKHTLQVNKLTSDSISLLTIWEELRDLIAHFAVDITSPGIISRLEVLLDRDLHEVFHNFENDQEFFEQVFLHSCTVLLGDSCDIHLNSNPEIANSF